MNDSEFPEFCNAMNLMSNIYSKNLDSEILEVYWQILKSYSIDEIKKSMNDHVRNKIVGQFFPKPSDIIKEIEGDSEKISLVALSKLKEGLSKEGGYCSNILIVYDDPIINFVIKKMGGEIKFHQSNDFEFKNLCNEFKKLYLIQFEKKEKIELELFKNKFDSKKDMQIRFVGNKENAKSNFIEFSKFKDEDVLLIESTNDNLKLENETLKIESKNETI